MDLSKFRLPQLLTVAVLSITIFISFLFFVSKVDGIKLLYATGGSTFDSAAYGNFTQTLQAGVQLERQDLHALSASKLYKYDVIYVDPALAKDNNWSEQSSKLMQFVAHGGHLLLENGFATSFPADFLGAGQVIDLKTSASIPKSGVPGFAYPQVPYNVQGVQQTFRLFSDSYFKHNPLETLPGLQWGYAFTPSSGQAVVMLNEVALSLVHHVGHGSVLISSNFLPNRYFLTGYDMQSGMDPAQGFSQLAAQYKAESKPVPGTTYFNKRDLPLEPYFDFSFAAANMQYRSELLAYVSKDKLGYSMRKVLGPYGRPAMAFQNHFEAMPAIAQKDGIAWAELLKKYQEIPSFTLVRNAFYWGQWRESMTVQLNTGTNAQPKFAGELPGSGYASGLHLMADGKPLRQALFPQYRDLASAIELPYRAYPAAADVNGDGRTDLLAGSADGFVYVYTNQGPNPAAYASEPPPAGAALPDTFGAAEKLMLASGKPLQLGPYTTVHAADVNGDARPDLIVSDESGAVWMLPQLAGGKFGPPAAVNAGGKPLQLPGGGPAAAAVADVNGDGKLDLVLGGADGRVWLYPGSSTNALTLQSGRVILTLPNGDTHAAPAVRDMNGDGRPDLVVGSNDGDLQVYLQDANGTWTAQGPLEGASLNQVGNHAIVAGHYSVPLWLDVNHDGNEDLIIGGVEFGSPVAIDDPKFPYPEQLKAFIQYAKEHNLDLNPHVYVHNYESTEEERTEVALHKQAFDKLGIPWLHPGTNQHTWRINNDDRLQTLQNEQQSRMWYNFGFLASHSQVLSRPEAIWSLPFLLEDQQGSTDQTMLVHTPTPVLRTGDYSTTDIFDSMVKLDMPIDYFEHIEYHFPEPAKIADLTQFADYFNKVRTKYDYNFMTETQMAQSFLTAMKSDVHISQSWASYIWNKLKDRMGHGTPHWHATITPSIGNVPSLAGDYANTLGVVIDKGEKLAQYSLESDSDIYTSQDNRIYIGLPKAASIGIQPVKDRLHLVRANVPFTMTGDNASRKIRLNAAGLQQLKFYSPQELQFEGLGDATVEHDSQAHTYTITRYGDSITFTLKKALAP